MTKTPLQPIICTGFHRSGTSLTAQILQQAGVNLGNNLMGGGFSNPDGHFEDLDVVRIHDKLLKRHQLTWQTTQPYPCNKDDIDIAQTAIDEYTHQRIAQANQSNSTSQASLTPYWGVKDPRLSLFLPYWHKSLDSKGIFVLPVRHWTECVQSLQSRHAKLLAYEIFPNPVTANHLSFWTEPLLASKMWLNYNREILNFVKQNPESCFILPHHQLMQGVDFISAINEKFAVNLTDVDYSTIIKPDYNTASEIMPIVTDSLPDSLIVELDDLYHELMSYAHSDTDDTKPMIHNKQLDQQLWQSAEVLVESQAKAQVGSENDTSNDNLESNKLRAEPITNVNKLDFEQAVELLKSTNIINTSQDFDYLLALTSRIIKLRPHFWQGHEWRGRIHLRLAEYGKAHNHLKNAIVFSANPPPYLHHLLSQITMENEQLGLALHYIAVAMQKNPNNPEFYLQKANVLTALKRQPAVKETLIQARERFPKNLQIQLRNLNILYQDEPQKAIKQAQTAWQQEGGDFYQNVKLGNWLSDRLIQQDSKDIQAKAIKQQIMRYKMQNSDLEDWLAQIIAQIDNNQQAVYLVYLILEAWHKLE